MERIVYISMRVIFLHLLLLTLVHSLFVNKLDLPTKRETTSAMKELDLTFIMDCTGSMGSYIDIAKRHIKEIVDEIVSSSNATVRLALIEYRDHPPQDNTFVTKTYNFTDSIFKMKIWLDAARASGGGDGPEAVAEGLYQATTLSWRQNAAKIAVLISDAPPHGLVPSEDRSFKSGSPTGHDPMQIVRDLAQQGVTLYVIGCEPAILPYKDFFMALEYLTGGQYVPLSKPELLVDVVTGGAKEELSIQKFEELVKAEIQRVNASGGVIDKDKIAETVYNQLSSSGATSGHLKLNNATLEGPSDMAKQIATATSMEQVRLHFHKAVIQNQFRPYFTYAPGVFHTTLAGMTYPPYPTAVYFSTPSYPYSGAMTGTGGTGSGSSFTGTGTMSGSGFTGTGTGTFTGTGTGTSGTFTGTGSGTLTGATGAMTGTGTGSFTGTGSGHTDKYTFVNSSVSIDQVDRLVQKILGR